MSFEPGELIGGRYELGRQLGAGGMARVYLGHDRLLDRQVAVKVLSEPYASDPQFVERFRREASAAAGLNHPNIVAVYDRGEADGSYYIVMEYLAGPDLKQVIRRRAPLPAVQAIDYAQQILAALGAAHRRDVIHRDVKPQNVLVAEDGHLKVTDFGIARAGAQSEMTEAGSVIGTAQYLSPEQARGDDVTAASDCYAVGIVLYEMLTGRVPFDGERPVTVAMKQISDPPTPPHVVAPEVPPELDAVVMKALAKRPSERYRTAGELSAALAEARAAIDGTGGTTRLMAAAEPTPSSATRMMEPVTGPTRVGPPPPDEPPTTRRRRWPWIVAALVVLAAVAAVAVLLLGGGSAKAVTVPPVTGMSAAEAQRTLEDAGLKVDLRTVTSASVPAGQAIGTEPAAGSQASEGDTVVLRVSGGPGQATVPDVTGKEQAAAQSELSRAGFTVNVTQQASDQTGKGFVISQDPAAGGRADRNSAVTIVVSTGPEKVTVPDIRRQGIASAEARLKSAGLVLGDVSQRPNANFPAGTIIRQDPGPNARVHKGASVSVVVATTPANVTVPSVIGNTATDAQTKLENVGFHVTSDEAPSDQPAGVVIDQSPAAGTSVQPGRTINITVSLGPQGSTGTLPGTTTGASGQPPPPTP